MSSSLSFLAVAHCLRTLSLVAFDLVVFGCPRRTPSGGVSGREPLPAKAVGPVPRAEGQASTGRRFRPLDAGGPESMVRLARRAGECPSGHVPALAPPGIPPLLALEVEDGGPTTPARPTGKRVTSAHSGAHWYREPAASFPRAACALPLPVFADALDGRADHTVELGSGKAGESLA